MADTAFIMNNPSCPHLPRVEEDQSSIIENTEMGLAFLLEERELLIHYEGGILPELEDLTGIATILNIGCGTGQWALETANLFPEMEILGVDPNQLAINYARQQAMHADIKNVDFLTMDITKPLKFYNNTFDLVNAQYLQGTLTTTMWPSFVQECVRVVRPGGIIHFTEAVGTESNSQDFNLLASLLPLALYHTGRSFAPGVSTLGITSMLGPLLRKVNCQSIRHHGFSVDYSSGTDNYNNAVHHTRTMYSHSFLGQFFIKTGIVSQENYQHLYDKAIQAMLSPNFCILSHFLSVSGIKAEEAGE